MNYELTKELKEAGFPQGGDGEYYGGPCTIPTAESMTYIPTLSELIDACGEAVHFILMKAGNMWQAGKGDNVLQGVTAYGSTPEEAVARLWLAFNRNE